ncbi:MAG TPA: GAF domain-containing protein, partial [Saprospiraceae bacterium]
MRIDFTKFPFTFKLELGPYINHVLKMGEISPELVSKELIARIKDAIIEHPQLMEIFDDVKDIEPYRDFFKVLFSTIIPLRGSSSSVQGVTLPFTAQSCLVATEAYEKLVDSKLHEFSVTDISISGESIDARILYGYKTILKKFYNLDLKVDHPIICEVYTHETGLSRYFKLTGQALFMDVNALGPLPAFDEVDLQQLLEKRFDPAEWANKLPPELFLFTGFTLTTLMDVTTEEAITRLQKNLLRRDFDNPEWFSHIRTDIQNLFRLQGLRLGIAMIQRNGAINLASQHPLWNSLLLKELEGNEEEIFHHSLYEDVLRTGQTIIIEDLQKSTFTKQSLVKGMLAAGFNNLMLVPLYYQDRLVGILELASPLQGEINGLSIFKINQVKPMFAIALMQLQDEFENRAEAIMMQQFTSIHPTIQWRFREAAINFMEENKDSIMQEDIVFEDVYPFYGSLDVRDSSRKRSKAIAQDLLLHLHSAKEVLQKGYDILSIDILEELIIDIEKCTDKVRSSFVSGDETGVAL